MRYKKIKIDFLLNKITTKDKLFRGNYTIDPYQNCEFGCLYCDSSFDKTIYVKMNSTEILKDELENTKKGTIIVGSVHDPYQKVEEDYRITRNLLKIIAQKGFSCHILTKSNLVLRDIDILSEIKKNIVTISIISLKNSVSKLFEKNVISTELRLQTIKKLNNEGIKVGLALIPILPYIVEEELEDIVKSVKNHNAEYLLHKHLELKGDQKAFFIKLLKKSYKDLVERYEKLYEGSFMPNNRYIFRIKNKINKLCKKYELNNRI